MAVFRFAPVQNLHTFLFSISVIMRVLGLNCLDSRNMEKSPTWYWYSVTILVYYLTQTFYNLMRFLIPVFQQERTLHKIFQLLIPCILQASAGCSALLINILKYRRKTEVLIKLYRVEDHWRRLGTRVMYSRSFHYKNTFFFICFMLAVLSSEVMAIFITKSSIYTPLIVIGMHARILAWTEVHYFLLILRIVRDHLMYVNRKLIRLRKTRSSVRIETLRNLSHIRDVLREVCEIQNSLYGCLIVPLTLFLTAQVICFWYHAVVYNISQLLSKGNDYDFTHWIGITTVVTINFIALYVVLKATVDISEKVRHIFWTFKRYNTRLQIMCFMLKGQNAVRLIQQLQFEVNDENLNTFVSYYFT